MSERITLAPRLTRQQVADDLGVSVKTIGNWTRRGILTATTWVSPGGRVYRDYDAAEVARLRESMGVDDSYRATNRG